ncbi:MAG TPA: isoprenylcysteine carboxylmethyltransferase family protein [Steroidobacteraceae bacterium]|jgi:protein-S-isoprenylcysteine O-methyltransferase Ste14
MRSRIDRRAPPTSATHAAVAWIGTLSMLASVAVLNFWPPFQQIAYLALIVMGCTALGVFIPDLLWQHVQRRVLKAAPAAVDWGRVGTKCVGLIGSVSFVALLYWVFPEYNQGDQFYGNYYQALQVLLPLWALLAVPYLFWVDRRIREPYDGLWQLGRALLGRWRGLSPWLIGQQLLGWLVKGYFLPLMFTYFCDNLNKLLHYDLTQLHQFQGVYDWAYFFLFFIDVSLVSMTYLMSLKATDTHIRSTEPSMLGWASALVCYQPFWSLISRQYIDYDTGQSWGVWFSPYPWLYDLWGCLILALVVVYVWATISFGARFSNLTHRGIITNGPYRYTKHPAYLSKNLSWWLISTPFMLTGGLDATVRRCVLLVALNLIYYIRAKTEERHLSLDPVYRGYADWIDEHGVLQFVNRMPLVGALARWRPVFAAYTPPAPFEDQPDGSGSRSGSRSNSVRVG